MNFIKKSIVIVLLISVSVASFAQKKDSSVQSKATVATEHITKKMNLDADKKAFVYAVMYEEYGTVIGKIRGKGLAKEEKKSIFKAANDVANKKLKEQFSNEEIKLINKYQQESNKLGKK